MCTRKDILATLTYFNLFDYPLKRREIFVFLGNTCSSNEFDDALSLLVDDAVVYRIGEFYSLRNEYSLSQRRTRGNEKARLMLKKADKAARIISHFPYVRGVAVSGSLSKNYADDTADIDFFIITAANRLWVSRSFLHLFKKLTFLFNRQHYFCMNYFIDEAGKEIIEKNIYTATEIVTLLPLRGGNVFDEFYAANSWTMNFLPNNFLRNSPAGNLPGTWVKKLLEKLFNNKTGDKLDTYLMNLTSKSWGMKTNNQKKNKRGIVMSLKASRHYSKPDPANFQFKLLKLYENNLEAVYSGMERSGWVEKEFL